MSISMTSSRPERVRLLRTICAVVAPLFLVACSSDRTNEWDAVVSIFGRVFGGPGEQVTYQQAAAIPFASIAVRLGDGPEGILVLGSSNGDQQLWTAASHIVLLTRGGRIVRTAGLEQNLSDMRLVKGKGSVDTVWEADLGELHLYSVSIKCHSTARGADTVNNFNTPVPVIRVDDECHSDRLDWSFTNTYWVSPQTGLMWKSIQHISPKMDPLQIRILRPPG
jgi:hypothetical protein